MSQIIGYDELFNFEDDSQLQKALADIAKLGAEYEKVSTSIRESIGEIKKVNKDMADTILSATEKLDSANESHRVQIVNNAKAADMLAESNKRLQKTEEDILKADIAYEQQMKAMVESMSSAERNIAALKVSLESLKSAQTAAKKEFESGKLSQDEYVNIVAKNSARQRELKTELSNAEKQLKANSQEVQSSYTSYTQMDQALQRLKKDYKNLTDEQRANEKVGGEILKQIADYDSQLKEIDATMGVHNRKVGEYENATKSLKLELREQIATLAMMKQAGQDTTEEYQQLMMKTGELADTISDVRSEVNKFASDTMAVDAAIQAFEGVASAFGLAQGAAALLGAQDDKLAKSFQQLQSIMVILNSLQSIQNLMQKESAVYGAVAILQSKMRIAYKNLETAAESKNIVVKGLATAAQWALNAAMYANPAVLIIVAILALTAAFLAFALSGDSAAEAQSKVNEQQKIGIERTERLFDSLQRGNKKQVQDLENEIALMKAQGKSKSDIYAKEMQLLTLKNRMANQAKGYYADEIYNLQNNYKKLDELKTLLEEYNMAKAEGNKTQVIIDFKTGETKRKKVDDEDIKAVEGMIENINSKIGEAENAMSSAAETEIERQQRITEEKKRLQDLGFKSRLGFIEAELLAVQKGTKKELDLKIQQIEQERRQALSAEDITAGEIAKINAKALQDKKKAQAEYKKAIIDDAQVILNTELINAQKGSAEELAIKKNLINKQLEEDLLGENLTANQRKQLKAKSLKDIEDLERDYRIRVQQASLDMQINLQRGLVALAKDGTDEKYQLEIQLNDLLMQNEINRINNSLELTELQKQAAISNIEAQTQAQNDALKKEQALKAFNRKKNDEDSKNNILRMDLEFQKENGNRKERLAATKSLADLNKEVLDKQFTDLEDLHKKGLISEEEYLNQKNELTQKAEEERLQILADAAENEKQLKEGLTNAGIDLVNIGFEAYKQASEARIQMLETERDNELATAGDNEKQKTAINDKYNKKIKAEKRKMAIADKLAALFQAGVNTALSITSALTIPPPAGPILAIANGIVGAAQIALIASKPLPQFWRGTASAPAGPAWVAENGPEAIEDRFGNVTVASGKQIRYLKGGEKIHTAGSAETRFYSQVLNSANGGFDANSTYSLSDIARNIVSMRDSHDRSILFESIRRSDMQELKSAFIQAVRELNIEENHWDEKGFSNFMRTKNSRVEDMNKRKRTGGEG